MVAHMDAKNRALCWAFRFPREGATKIKLADIIKKKLVICTDGHVPSEGAISEAARNHLAEKNQRGRKDGWRKTSKVEDRKVFATMKKLRPPGHYVDSRIVHRALNKKLRKKISRKTVIRRLAEKGLKPEKKLDRNDHGPMTRSRRLAVVTKYLNKTAREWTTDLQAVGDATEFTWYPKVLQPRFKQLRARWTYMTKKEKTQAAFLRPKRWFKRSEYKQVKKQRLFGFTTSNGKSLNFLIPKPWSTEIWAEDIKNKVVPFLRSAFPGRRSFTVLIDGEALLHGPAAKAAMAAGGITIFSGWPGYSPDMNPQENVWAWAEPELRRLENDDDPFEEWVKKTMKACDAYPASKTLVASMANRMRAIYDSDGAATKY